MSAGARRRNCSKRQSTWSFGEHLDADVARAGRAVFVDSRCNRCLIAPSDERVDQSITATIGDFIVGEAEALPVVRVVGQQEVIGEVGAGDRPGSICVGLQHHTLLSGDERIWPDRLSRKMSVLWCHEVGVDPCSPGRGQFEHLRAQRGECTILDRKRDGSGVERVEKRAHLSQRLPIGARLDPGVDQRRVTDPDPDKESIAVLHGQRRVVRGSFFRCVHPQVEDARGDGRCRGSSEKVLDRAEHVAADVGNPHGGVAECFQFAGRCGDLVGVAVSERAAPHAGTDQWLRHTDQPATGTVFS